MTLNVSTARSLLFSIVFVLNALGLSDKAINCHTHARVNCLAQFHIIQCQSRTNIRRKRNGLGNFTDVLGAVTYTFTNGVSVCCYINKHVQFDLHTHKKTLYWVMYRSQLKEFILIFLLIRIDKSLCGFACVFTMIIAVMQIKAFCRIYCLNLNTKFYQLSCC